MINKIAYILVLIGAVNWGLYGINVDLNLIDAVFGSITWLERLMYVIVGLSALWLLFSKKK